MYVDIKKCHSFLLMQTNSHCLQLTDRKDTLDASEVQALPGGHFTATDGHLAHHMLQ